MGRRIVYSLDDLAVNSLNTLIDKGYRFDINYDNIKPLTEDELAYEIIKQYEEYINSLEIKT